MDEFFTAIANWSDGRTEDVTTRAAWTSSATDIARVTGGRVTGVSPGSATISATFNGVSGGRPVQIVAAVALTPFLRDYIEALFLGSGPLTPTDGVRGCPRNGFWSAYPQGTAVQIVVSTTVPADIPSLLEAAAADVAPFTSGWLTTSLRSTTAEDPIPAANEVTVTTLPNPLASGCAFPQGCTRFAFGGSALTIVSARSILQTGQFPGAYMHDAVGHGVLGLCHVDGNLIGGASRSLMSFGPGVFSNQLPNVLSADDRAAIEAVFRSGLSAGASRAAFAQAGLINADSAQHPDALPHAVVGEIAAPRIR